MRPSSLQNLAITAVVILLTLGSLAPSMSGQSGPESLVPALPPAPQVPPYVEELDDLPGMPDGEDQDGDGLSTDEEATYNTDAADRDSDDDWILDGDEVLIHETDPNARDSDDDGVPDYFEISREMDPNDAADGLGDLDNDSWDEDADGALEVEWTGVKEYLFRYPDGWDESVSGPWWYGTLPAHADSDEDGFSDGYEVFHGNGTRAGPVPDPSADGPEGIDPFADEDGDGLTLYWEWEQGTDPYNADTDGDGLCDGGGTLVCATFIGGEDEYDGQPSNFDSDGDGIGDGAEVVLWQYPFDADGNGWTGVADADNDGDGLSDGLEVILGTNFRGTDTDADGLADGHEHLIGTNPLLADSDEDGLPDFAEHFVHWTSNFDADTDGDQLDDALEISLGTDPLESDTDLDRMPDAFEVENGLQATLRDADLDLDGDGLSNLQEFQLEISVNNPDHDGDGALDGWEVRYGLDPASDQASDADNDGVPDNMEFALGTVPGLFDTDLDGLSDIQEADYYMTDPLDYDSDDDGLWDGIEYEKWTQYPPLYWKTGTTPSASAYPNCATLSVRPPPSCTPSFQASAGNALRSWDTDRDGVSDRDEMVVSKTSPASPASNADGTTDLVYVLKRSGTGVTELQRFAESVDPSLWSSIMNPASPTDWDGDGLSNTQETGTYSTNPSQRDTDCDGIADGLEKLYWGTAWNTGGNRLRTRDWDADGLPDGVEINLLAEPNAATSYSLPDDADTDDDGLSDYEERPAAGAQCTAPKPPIPGASSSTAGAPTPPLALLSDPVLPDTDFDGLLDLIEIDLGSNPTLCDTDGDGLGDGLEMGVGIHTVNLPSQLNHPCTQFDADPGNTTSAIDRDTDNDGLLDGQEDPNRNGMVEPNLVEGDPNLGDSDRDTLPDADEFNALRAKLDCLLRVDCDGDDLRDDVDGPRLQVATQDSFFNTGFAWFADFDVDLDEEPSFADKDSDNDEVEDGDESGTRASDGQFFAYYANPDGDATEDGYSRQNILDTDSDDDGLPDGVERGIGPNAQGLIQSDWLNANVDGDENADGVPLVDGVDLLPSSADELLQLNFSLIEITSNVDPAVPGDGQTRRQGEPYISDLEVYLQDPTDDDTPSTPILDVGTEDDWRVQTNAAGKHPNLDEKFEDLNGVEAGFVKLTLPQDFLAYVAQTNKPEDLGVWIAVGVRDFDVGSGHERLDIDGKQATGASGGEQNKMHLEGILLSKLLEGRKVQLTMDGRRDGDNGEPFDSDGDTEDNANVIAHLGVPAAYNLNHLPELAKRSCVPGVGTTPIHCNGYSQT